MKKMLCILLAMLMLLGLCACGQSAAPNAVDAAPAETDAQTEAEEASEVEYSISVADEEGNPIPGVKVQFCDDATCTLGDTDEKGAAVFTAKEGTYTVHVLNAPEGFVGTEEEFAFPDAGREIGITLETLKPAIDRPIIGFSYYDPKAYKDLKGKIEWEVNQITNDVYLLDPVYLTDDSDSYVPLFELFCVQKDEAEAEAYLKDSVRPPTSWDAYTLEKVGSAENVTCFLVQENDPEEDQELYESIYGDLYDEFASLRADKETFRSGIRLQEPAPKILVFETQDTDGNTVSFADILPDHKVTMVNLWATWCGPCTEELPDLQKLSKEFEAQDCQIIGICLDYQEGEDTTEVKKILEDAGVTYLNLLAPKEEVELLQISTYPTTYFVNSEGRLLTMQLQGAYPSPYTWVYTNALKDALSKLEK